MKTVKQIMESTSDNKSAEYLGLSRELADKANDLSSKNSDIMFIDKMAHEVVMSMRKCEQADCEYSAYTAANSAETWFNKIAERV